MIQPAVSDSTHSNSLHASTGRVVVVDDEPAVVDVAASILEAAGFSVVRATSAIDCLEQLELAPVDAVLTDVCMDGMDGFELIGILAERAPATRVVVMTGYDSYEMLRTAIATGAYDYIDKPLQDHEALVASMMRAVESGRLQRRNDELVTQLGAANAGLEKANAQLIELNRRLRLLANTDGLTRLYNRRYADQFISRELARSQRFGDSLTVALIDVDHFKHFNDTHGHAGGDRALQSVARCLRSSVRSVDLVARYGGEEFIVVLPGTAPEAGMVFADRLRNSIASLCAPNEYDAGELTVSIGLAGVDTAVAPLERVSLVGAADNALYEAKGAGRNCVVRSTTPFAGCMSTRAA